MYERAIAGESGATTLRALIIGTGSIGQRHMRNLRVLAPDLQFVLLRRDNQVLQSWPDAVVVTDFESARRLNPDLAILANPSAHHFDILQALIAARIPTYVEKPIVTTTQQVVQIRESLTRFDNVPHAAGFNLRMLPSLEVARQWIQAGKLGPIARASFSAGQWLPDWRKGQDHRRSYSSHSAEGGGVLFDLCHEFDAARYFLGELHILCAATSRIDALEIDSEGAAIATVRSASNVIASINLDYVSRQPIRRYELVGIDGTLVWDLPTRTLTVRTSTGHTELTTNPSDFDVSRTYETAMSGFLRAVESGSQNMLQDLRDGLRSTELAIFAHGSDIER